MKRFAAALLVLIFALSCFPAVSFADGAADDEISICVNGKYYTFDQMPVMKSDRVLVPLRGISELLGAEVSWSEETKTVGISKDALDVSLTLDKSEASINGKNVTLDVPATSVNYRTMVPVRFVSESLGAFVSWNDDQKTVDIKTILSQKAYNFDDGISDTAYTMGGGYAKSKVSVSDEYDHTGTNGKSLKLSGMSTAVHRIKFTDMFSKDDIGKKKTISAWIYSPSGDTTVRLGTYGDTGTKNAAAPLKMKNFEIKKGVWTNVLLEYEHKDETITQVGFDQLGAKEVTDTLYIDDLSVYEPSETNFSNLTAVTGGYSSYEIAKNRKTEVGYSQNFDDETKFVYGKEFTTGGGFQARNITVSSEKDHTSGSGKSLKIENAKAVSHRVKFINSFSDKDLKKYFKISFYIYIDNPAAEEASTLTVGVYDDVGFPNAAASKGVTNTSVKPNEWVYVEALCVHENPLTTQLGMNLAKNYATMYIDDLKIEESDIMKNGRRDVMKSTLTSTKDPYDLKYYDNPVEKRLNFEDLPEGKLIYSTERLLKASYTAGEYGKGEIVDAPDMPLKKAWRITVENDPPLEYSCQLELGNLSESDYAPGDVCLAQIQMRTISSEHESACGTVQVICEQNGGTHAKCLKGDLATKDDGKWYTAYFPFVIQSPRLTIRTGFDNQVVEVGDYNIYNYKDTVDINTLPVSDSIRKLYNTYFDKDAQWRKDAIARIEKIRKGDINVIVKDANGNPVKDADVSVDMYEHEFSFGSAFNGNANRESATDSILYRKYFSKVFNTAVSESDHKPKQYMTDATVPEKAAALVKIAKDIGVENYRGHVLMTDNINPAIDEFELPDFTKMTDAEKETFKKQLNTVREKYVKRLMTDFSGQLCEWDVLNEAISVHKLRDVYGLELYKEWFDIARKYADPGLDLFYNEARVFDSNFYQLMRDMIAEGVDFQGIGLESHVRATDVEDVINMFETVCSFGKKVAITEFDNNETDKELQASFTRNFLILAFSYEPVTRFVTWGFNDKSHWLRNAPIYNPDWTLKPSGEQFVDLVYNKWWTEEKRKTNDEGTYSVRGYYGDYDITVSANGKTKTVSVPCRKGNDNTIVITLD